MRNAEIMDKKAERALMLGIWTDKDEKLGADSLLQELKVLAKTAEIEAADIQLIKLREYVPATLLGKGKTQEIKELIEAKGADSVIFDCQLSPLQQRNLEAQWGVKVFDRSELIIRIFAKRAQTKEAQLQVELARMQYFLPRLLHAHDDLNRQKGGRYGTKDSGEKQLELDRRQIEQRIDKIKDELIEVRKIRATQRKRREKSGVLHVSLVGYTNAGKSTLFNRLTKAGVFAENKLFATLDTTTRRINLYGKDLVLTDTVGFIRNLPHGLVAAFKATLEEAVYSDVLMIIVDSADPERDKQLATTREVLQEIGCAGIPSVVVLNKIDLVPGFRKEHAECDFAVSSVTSEGIGEILEYFRSLNSSGTKDRKS